jgi:hypothetical protein
MLVTVPRNVRSAPLELLGVDALLGLAEASSADWGADGLSWSGAQP